MLFSYNGLLGFRIKIQQLHTGHIALDLSVLQKEMCFHALHDHLQELLSATRVKPASGLHGWLKIDGDWELSSRPWTIEGDVMLMVFRHLSARHISENLQWDPTFLERFELH